MAYMDNLSMSDLKATIDQNYIKLEGERFTFWLNKNQAKGLRKALDEFLGPNEKVFHKGLKRLKYIG